MDISFLRERQDTAMTVSELNMLIKGMFDSNRLLSSVYIKGEISNFVNHRSGHLYFTLKDDEGQISAVMFKSSAVRLKFVPENGMKVTVFGTVTVYPKGGTYQIYVNSMQPDGVGALYMAYEQLKSRLASEGIFDASHKKSIPQFPARIGVITSPTGAAVRDIINVIGRRCPGVHIYVYPALVQGDGAVDTLLEALDYFDTSKLVDTVIIGRGGGSIEDLWAFNSEALARRIYDCTVPIISAVGHETDFTICDFAADLRAPTPSAAAELCVPDVREIYMKLDSLVDRCDRSLQRLLERKKEILISFKERAEARTPSKIIIDLRERLSMISKNAEMAYSSKLHACRSGFEICCKKLEVLNPLSILLRGYSVVESKGKIVKTIKELNVGDELEIRIADGNLEVSVDKITSCRGDEYVGY